MPPRLTVALLLLAGCPGPFWGRICLGGTTTPSEACVVADGSMVALVGGVVGAHALNHDPYDAISAALAKGDAGHPAPPVDSGPPQQELIKLPDGGEAECIGDVCVLLEPLKNGGP